jgi:GNAT superfamily N-acetyltransferase
MNEARTLMSGRIALNDVVHRANADAWHAEALLRARQGGEFARLPGVEVVTTGAPMVWANRGTRIDGEDVDVDSVEEWFGSRGIRPRIATRESWPLEWGEVEHEKPLMGLSADNFRGAGPVDDVVVRVADRSDFDAVLHTDIAGFESTDDNQRYWIGPALESPDYTFLLATIDDQPVAVANLLCTDLTAGPCAGIYGVATLPAFRGRGIASHLVSRLAAFAFDGGTLLIHLGAATPDAQRIYERLGFVLVERELVYVGPETRSDS